LLDGNDGCEPPPDKALEVIRALNPGLVGAARAVIAFLAPASIEGWTCSIKRAGLSVFAQRVAKIHNGHANSGPAKVPRDRGERPRASGFM